MQKYDGKITDLTYTIFNWVISNQDIIIHPWDFLQKHVAHNTIDIQDTQICWVNFFNKMLMVLILKKPSYIKYIIFHKWYVQELEHFSDLKKFATLSITLLSVGMKEKEMSSNLGTWSSHGTTIDPSQDTASTDLHWHALHRGNTWERTACACQGGTSLPVFQSHLEWLLC